MKFSIKNQCETLVFSVALLVPLVASMAAYPGATLPLSCVVLLLFFLQPVYRSDLFKLVEIRLIENEEKLIKLRNALVVPIVILSGLAVYFF